MINSRKIILSELNQLNDEENVYALRMKWSDRRSSIGRLDLITRLRRESPCDIDRLTIRTTHCNSSHYQMNSFKQKKYGIFKVKM